jgi:hypothetical protein
MSAFDCNCSFFIVEFGIGLLIFGSGAVFGIIVNELQTERNRREEYADRAIYALEHPTEAIGQLENAKMVLKNVADKTK